MRFSSSENIPCQITPKNFPQNVPLLRQMAEACSRPQVNHIKGFVQSVTAWSLSLRHLAHRERNAARSLRAVMLENSKQIRHVRADARD